MLIQPMRDEAYQKLTNGQTFIQTGLDFIYEMVSQKTLFQTDTIVIYFDFDKIP